MKSNLKKKQKDMYQGLWFGTIVLSMVVASFWIFPEKTQMGTREALKWTIIAFFGLGIGWIFFYRQKMIDERKIAPKKGPVEDIFQGANTIHGIRLKYYSIKMLVVMIIFSLGGIYLLIFDPEFWWLGIILLIIGALIPIAIKNLWKVGDQKTKGRYY